MSKSNEEKVQALLIALQQPTISTDTACIAAKYISNLYDWLIHEALCPCCDEVDACDDECTLSEDCPSDAERVTYARDVLKVPA